MSRRAKPAKVNAKAKRPLARKAPTKGAARVRDLEKRLAETSALLQEKDRALTEALEQQTATSEILRVISSSPTNLQPVLDAIATNAALVCDAYDAVVFLREGDRLRTAAHYGPITITLQHSTLNRGSVTEVAILDRQPVHVHDVLATEPPVFPLTAEAARRGGFRTVLSVPLLRENEAIGALAIRRREVQPFTTQQIDLLKTFADQAVIAIENVRLFNETKEALEQQTATSEILRVISSSPTDIQPVLDALVESAARLCRSVECSIFLLDGDRLALRARYGPPPATPAEVVGEFALPIVRGTVGGRTVLERRTIHVVDLLGEADEFPQAQQNAVRYGHRTMLSVPLIREGAALGVIQLRRTEVNPFTDRQADLLQTFADQAVIAIENVRLFTELQEKNRAVTEALEQQTATSAILRAIAASPTEVQPTLDTIVENAGRVCDAQDATLFLADGTEIVLRAYHGAPGMGTLPLGARLPLTRDSVSGRVIVDASPIHVHDVQTTPDFAAVRALALQFGYRTALGVPLVRDARAFGAILIRRTEARPFLDTHIELLKTFADQAMIAIENVRLFTELQTSNRELTTALDTQTATSDILRVISRSQTDVQPVFDAIVTSAVRLLAGYGGSLTRVAGDQLELAALTSTDAVGDAAQRARFPMSIRSEGVHPTVIRRRAPVNIADAYTDLRVPEGGRAIARARGYRSLAGVPLLRHDEAVGTIAVIRREPGGFTDDEIALLQTFADQAVIAIENARLLRELQARTEDLTRSVGELRALGEIGQAIGSTLDLQTVLATIVARATELAGAEAGVIYEYDAQREVFEPRATERLEDEIVRALVATPVRKGQGATGRLAEVAEPVQLADVRTVTAQVPVRSALIDAGYRALLAVPLVREGRLIGGLTVFRRTTGEFAPNVVELMQTFATQSALAIQNARLFREIEVKSRELEVASQHKSEFLASMSHELRTPLNAVIGFSDVLLQGMFGETNEKQTEYLRDILASGQHLLSLINDILDLSKIEAGKMELDVAAFDLPTAIDDALLLMRERASRRGITLERRVDARVGEIRGDQRKVKQVLLNLLSNAVKFTPEVGRIDVRAGVADDMAEISVTDTGIGIAPEDHDAVFEEFRQVGAADKKAEGTGLGLALCRKFVELHGGRIWVKSQVGVGSTFTFTLPLSQ